MSDKNPFTSKSSNSRFSKDAFFSEEDTKNQEKRKKPDHLSTNTNTFLVEKDKNVQPTKNTYKPRDQGRNNDRRQTFFSQPKEIKPVTFDITNEEFPELASPANSASSTDINVTEKITEGKNFLDAINTVTIVEEDYDKIKPGWIVIYRNKDEYQINSTEGELTEYQLKEKEKAIAQDNPNFIMEQIHEELCNKWEKNIASYDCIHGEGAYEKVYYLPPVYDDFYNYDDYESDDDNAFDNNDIDDYSDRGWTSDYE
jgi:hypothetical protein